MTDDRPGTDTAERLAVVVPRSGPPAAAPGASPPVPPDRAGPPSKHRGKPAPPWIAWLVVGVTLVFVAVLGAWLVVRDPGTEPTATDPAVTESEGPGDAEEPAAEESPTEDPSPSEEPPTSEEPPADPVDLTGSATPQVPETAPPSRDVDGTPVTFDAANMMDGDPATAWRMTGDGTGAMLTFTFPEAVTVSRVGVVNGWAKTTVGDGGAEYDWYHGNRRLLRAEWVVGDQVFPQDLADSTAMQTLDIEPTETTTIGLRLIEISPPGTGSTGRDFTALSDVSFLGTQP